MKIYKILWFDDQHESLDSIKDDAMLEQIQLFGFSNAEEGLKELEENHENYDAVLLDGLFYENKDQKGTDIDDSAFGKVAHKLSLLKAKGNYLPWFIFSGQTKFLKGDSPFIRLFVNESAANGKVFDKSKDFEVLLKEIKKAVDELPVFKLKKENPKIFEIFELGFMPYEVEKQLINLLLRPEPKDKSEFKEILVNIRSVHESCFIKLESIRVLPKLETFSKKVKHLSGNYDFNRKTNTTQVYQTSEIENLHKWIYFTCGTYIHYLENEHNEGYMISNYALDSLKYGLLEILLWFKKVYSEFK